MSKRSLGSRIDKDECRRESPGQKKPWGEKVVVTGYASWFTNEKGTQWREREGEGSFFFALTGLQIGSCRLGGCKNERETQPSVRFCVPSTNEM